MCARMPLSALDACVYMHGAVVILPSVTANEGTKVLPQYVIRLVYSVDADVRAPWYTAAQSTTRTQTQTHRHKDALRCKTTCQSNA